MSPMSRWSRNWMPLTTRPSRTSRQGMILAAGIDRFFQAETLLPERLAHDRPGCADPLQRAQVVERGDATRGLHIERGAMRDDLGDQALIGPGHHAVAADIGDEDVARFGKKGERVPEADARGFLPAG